MKKYLLIIIGTGLFGLFLFNMGFGNVVNAFATANIYFIFPVILLNLGVLLLKSWRWKILLFNYGITLSFPDRFISVSSGFFLGLVTPGTVGELGRSLSTNIDKSKSLGTVIFEKLFDLLSLFIISVGALAFFYMEVYTAFLLLSIISVGSAGILFLLVKKRKLVRRVFKKVLSVPGLLKRKQELNSIYYIFISLLNDTRIVLLSILVSIGLWSITGIQFYLLLKALNFTPSFNMVTVCCFVPYLASVLSFIPLGLGILDFSMVGLFNILFGIPNPLAYSITILFRLFATFPLVIWGYCCYLYSLLSKNKTLFSANIKIKSIIK